ncbi:MAG: hypothetical protein GY930_11425 [bacterium]|nr:hypothetical protein [bacterium]
MTGPSANLNPLSTVHYVGGRLREAIQQGYPEVGWEGDPNIVPTYNPRSEEWQVYDNVFSPPRLIISKKAEGLRDLDAMRGICEKLRKAQVRGQGVQTIYQRIQSRNDAIESEHARNSRDLVEGTTHELLGAIR